MQDNQQLVYKLEARFGHWFEDEQKLEQGRMTDDLYPYEALFSPIQINGIRVKNRIVMGPMGNILVSNPLGRPNAKLIQYYTERAKGGVGLITSGLIPINARIEPVITGKWNDSILPRIEGSLTVNSGWQDLFSSVHAHGAHFFVQLTPGFGRVGPPACLLKGKLPISASWNPNHHIPQIPCRPLTDGQCRRLIKSAGTVAMMAKGVGADGVYLHGHEGYLMDQMTNPAFNRRKLSHFAEWQAFGIEMIQEIRKRTGPRYPIMYRIDLSLALEETYRGRMDQDKILRKFQDGRTAAMTLEYMRNLVKAGVDIFDVDLGCYENWWLPHPPNGMPPGCFLPVAQLVKDDFAAHGVRSNAGLEVPVVAVGKLGYPDLAERALREGQCDMVMLARPLLADPEWPNKAYAGRVKEIVPCIGDQRCLNQLTNVGHSYCAVNPRTYFEEQLPEPLTPTLNPKKVAVVGAGPAGVMCACTAARRGHDVTLYERNDRAGGILIPGSAAKIKFDVANYLAYLNETVSRHVQDYDLRTNFNTEATVDTLQATDYDAIITCTGAQPIYPKVPGIDLPHVVTAVDLLRGAAAGQELARLAQARNVVVVGGGEVGCETAYYLAYEHDKHVTVIEMLPHFMTGTCTANRGFFIHYLERKGVKLLNCTRLTGVEETVVIVMRNLSPTVPDPYVTWIPLLSEAIPNPLAKSVKVEEKESVIPADLVVLATGMTPNNALYEACVQHHAAPLIKKIGDAFTPASITEATRAGYMVARAL
jgi:2-enoate reductase